MSERTERIRDGEGWELEAGYSRAVRRGGRIEVSGTTARAELARLHPDDTYRQAKDALERSVDAVTRLGGGLEDVVRSRVMLVPKADWRAASRAHREVLERASPANTLVFVAALVGDDFLCEVELQAEVLDEQESTT
jgi:enamine deaminase RidA (YjgF/YER057c/UK114 family)